MSSQDEALPAVAHPRTLDDVAAWFWRFLKTELTPYPGRAWVVLRITIAATIVMALIMTLGIPYGFLGALSTFFLSRENPAATLRGAVEMAVISAAAALYTIVGVMTMVGDPLTHFLWIGASFFLTFYVIHIVPDYPAAAMFGALLAVPIPIWDDAALTVSERTESTLWLSFSVVVGAAVTVAVEYVSHRMHPAADLTLGIESRLRAVEDVLRRSAADVFAGDNLEKEISLYSALGTSRLRRQLLNSGYPLSLIAQMSAAVALLGRLVDLAAGLLTVRTTRSVVIGASDRDRCLRLAAEVFNLRCDFERRQLPRTIDIPSQPEPSDLPLLPEMERTVALISHAFSGTTSVEVPLDAKVQSRLLVPDVFSNPDHLKFAVRGALATMLAYVLYQVIDSPGLSTAVIICAFTALSTVGSSRQSQLLRLVGAIVGGFGFGMGAQVLVLPYLDSIAGFTVLFAVVTAISAWLATATPRLSYVGVQAAMLFYLINLQEFAMQTSLAVTRDRVVGILLGLSCMWLVFDRLWVRGALQEMQDAFSRNLQMLAELFEQSCNDGREEAAKRVLQLRDQINAGFDAVRAQSDAVLFEFGPSRERKLRIRDNFRRWQPTLGALLHVQIAFLQHISGTRFAELPPKIAKAQTAFERDMAIVTQTMSNDVAGKMTSTAPDIQESASALRREIHQHYGRAGLPIPPPFAGIITLTQNLASIVTPLYVDIHATFMNPQRAAIHNPGTTISERDE